MDKATKEDNGRLPDDIFADDRVLAVHHPRFSGTQAWEAIVLAPGSFRMKFLDGHQNIPGGLRAISCGTRAELADAVRVFLTAYCDLCAS